MKSKHSLGVTLTLFLVPAALLACFTPLDLAVSQALVGQARGFGRFFETIGQIPLMSFLLVAPPVLWLTRTKRHWAVEVLRGLGILILSALGAFVLSVQTVMYVVGESQFQFGPSLPFLLAGAGVLMGAAFVTLGWMGRTRLLPARRVAWIGLCLAVADALLIENLKNLFGRVRPREMAGPADFAPWYLVHGNTHHQSFPSGHSSYSFAGAAWALLAKSGTPARRWAMAVAVAFGLCTALSRVLLGAHFPTDVIAGGWITLVLVWILDRTFRPTVGLEGDR